MLTDEEIQKIAETVLKKLVINGMEYGPLAHMHSATQMMVDDVLWYHKVGGLAYIDKVTLTGPPSQYQLNPTAQGAGNRVTFSAYTFIPRNLKKGEKSPLIVLPHGGVHSNFNSMASNVVGELVAQGYVVVAPEYRGSTGYGKEFYELIDYGGLESEDTYESKKFMVENYDCVDSERVGIMGWSHGGMHTLFNIFNHPTDYQAAHASVPVSDVVARMGYKSQSYRDLFEAEYHIGKSGNDDYSNYKRRSPAWNVPEYQPNVHPPLLVHSTENDQDVNVLEVEHLIKSLKFKKWDFEYKIYPPTPGAHGFSRLDTRFSKGVRGEIYEFLAKHLDPPSENPVKQYIGAPNPLET
ncbi:MAG: prolyl oligopeptidase family serine peptidase [Candidatus Bathyarchaeota archaeon]